MSPRYAESTDYVCLEARGADAAAFLHGQLSLAVANLDAQRAPLAGWHDARGRVRALLRVCRLSDRWWLVTAREGAADVLKKLRLFVLRSAVTLEFAPEIAVGAVLGADDAWLARHGITARVQPNQIVAQGELQWIRVGPGYWQVLGKAETLASLAAELTPAAPEAVALAEIGLGIPVVVPSLGERFVAQMLNLDALGAVSFDKGCYPGQEVIARVHHLGDVKRHARRYSSAGAPPTAGAAVTLGASGAAVGEVVRSATTAEGSELLAVVDQAAVGEELRCGAAPLVELPLPFVLPGPNSRA